ncbi:MAG TPA: type II toxin-antitoxin system HicB family antitoxin [Thermoanaerobaculia bacterium]|jgi:predicted RNase H-like HicB family nuclease
MLKNVKIIVEKHPDGYVAYPVGLRGVVVAQGDTCEEALAEARSAIQFHLETFGREVLEEEDAATEVFIAETAIAV